MDANPESAKTGTRYIEDVQVGERWSSPEFFITEEEIIAFAMQFDAQPMHTDPAAASQGPFGGLIASGWHLSALMMKKNVEQRHFGETPILGAGVDELRWKKPVRPGDRLSIDWEIAEITLPKPGRSQGRVRTKTTLKSNGEAAMTLFTLTVVSSRHPAGGA